MSGSRQEFASGKQANSQATRSVAILTPGVLLLLSAGRTERIGATFLPRVHSRSKLQYEFAPSIQQTRKQPEVTIEHEFVQQTRKQRVALPLPHPHTERSSEARLALEQSDPALGNSATPNQQKPTFNASY